MEHAKKNSRQGTIDKQLVSRVKENRSNNWAAPDLQEV